MYLCAKIASLTEISTTQSSHLLLPSSVLIRHCYQYTKVRSGRI